jgi:centromere/kinetochore protein ZW10
MEGLFSEDPDQPSFVVAYVPSWLKFSYLSELLEASLADISYLFEQGALVDFHVNELVNLVRALFADTSLRTNTINKLLTGHPVASQ